MRKGLVPAPLRREVAERARGLCEYCMSQAAFSGQSFSVEHIRPRSRGGATRSDNLALACQGCNGHKYAKVEAPDPATGLAVLLFHPRRQSWGEHFRWSDDSTLVIGITPTGRATVAALLLNRPGVVNLRRALVIQGFHPPADPAIL